MAIKYLSKQRVGNLKGVALVRIDLNDKDGWRLETSLPTLELLTETARKMVIISHRGRPEPSLTAYENKKFSLEGEAEKISKKIGKEVKFISHTRISEAGNEIRMASEGSVFLLENIRFLDGEYDNSHDLAEHLSSLGDYFVNDAFAVCHREQASVAGIPKFLPSFAGLRLEEEVEMLSKVMKRPKKPVVLIIGGAKVKDKLPVLINFRKKVDFILAGGAVANTIFYLQGEKVGRSLVDKEMDGALTKAAEMPQMVLPIDTRREGVRILDIGPKTEKEFVKIIKKAKTIIWGGPLGMTDKKKFDKGSRVVAKAMAARRSAITVVGGGETVDFVRKLKLEESFDLVSTGGGAMLDFLAGKRMPGIEALNN